MKNSALSGQLPLNFYQELWKQSLLAIGRTAPNPPVAAIITYQNQIIASGATEPPGLRHAEIVALDEIDHQIHKYPNHLCLYVTLEPCSTYGRTKPCVLRINHYQDRIEKIFLENFDPYLNKTGIKYLIEKGFDVKVQSFFKKPHFALEPFFSVIKQKRPIYHIKVATMPDGLMGVSNKSISITGKLGKFITMLMRAKVDAVIVGPGTTSIDLPSLDLREINLDDEELAIVEKSMDYLNKNTQLLYNDYPKVYYDEFLRGLILFYKDIYKNFQYFNYQPKRILILGRYFSNFINFFKKQKQLTENTDQPFYFLIQEKYKNDYPLEKLDKENIRIFPNLDSENFFSELNQFLIEIDVHRALIESGERFFSVSFPHLTKNDKIYWIENTSFEENQSEELPLSERKHWFISNYDLILKDKFSLGHLNLYALTV